MKDIREKTDTDLQTFVKDKREALRALRFSASGSGMRDVKAFRNIKREVARGLTELNARKNAK